MRRLFNRHPKLIFTLAVLFFCVHLALFAHIWIVAAEKGFTGLFVLCYLTLLCTILFIIIYRRSQRLYKIMMEEPTHDQRKDERVYCKDN
ncbi:MAG: hypothetical protein PHT58_04675 [Eubacteriales bacterium]|nr:hypothetical protein [Eubacteriales bacterium]